MTNQLSKLQLWRKNNPDKYRLQRQKWIEKNLDKVFKKRKSDNEKRIKFKGKTIFLKQKIRIGVCSNCKKSVKTGEIKQTQMHHIKYDQKNPEKYTVELCVSCHRKEHKKLNKVK